MFRIAALTLLALLCAAVPAQARSKPLVGFGEQNPRIFSDLRWVELDGNEQRLIRYVMPWDSLQRARDRGPVDLWMHAAEYRHAKVLLSFGHSNRPNRQFKVPTRAQYRAAIKAVRKRYPFVTTFHTWNEANHGFQPTYRKPKAAARLFDVLVKTCRGCTVTAPSVLDDGMKTARWIQAFDQAAKHRVKIWALHNHIDANRNQTSGTRLFLQATRRGQVWVTESGGIWNRWVPKPNGRKRHVTMYTHSSAVRAIRNIFKLQRLNPRRIKRIYIYNWFAPAERKPRWDSGLIGPTGRERPTYRTLRAQLRKYGR
jgi:hypothetical protein